MNHILFFVTQGALMKLCFSQLLQEWVHLTGFLERGSEI